MPLGACPAKGRMVQVLSELDQMRARVDGRSCEEKEQANGP